MAGNARNVHPSNPASRNPGDTLPTYQTNVAEAPGDAEALCLREDREVATTRVLHPDPARRASQPAGT
jgi:hypothetical protein